MTRTPCATGVGAGRPVELVLPTLICGTWREDLAPLTSWYGKALEREPVRGTRRRPAAGRSRPTLRQVHPEMSAGDCRCGEEAGVRTRELVAPAAPAEAASTGARACPTRRMPCLRTSLRWWIGAVEYSTDGWRGSRWRGGLAARLRARHRDRAGDQRWLLLMTRSRPESATARSDGAGVDAQADGVDVPHPAGTGRSPAQPRSRLEASGRNLIRGPTTMRPRRFFTVSTDHVGPDEARAGRWVLGTARRAPRVTGSHLTSTQLRIDGAMPTASTRGYMVTGWV